MKVVFAKQMRELDELTINSGIPGHVLMERAGAGAFQEILSFVDDIGWQHGKHFIILAGKGNNGGDGYVIARLLAQNTTSKVSVYSICAIEKLKGDALLNAVRIPCRVEFKEIHHLPDECFTEGTIFVDCLLGTGIRGSIKEPYSNFIHQVNCSSLPVIAIDIPSGINADNGKIENIAMQADLTITMGLPKAGLFLGQGMEYCGRTRLVDIGIRKNLIEEIDSPFEAIFHQDIGLVFTRLSKTVHKAMLGRILIVGGSEKFPGAPLLSGCAALRAGGGLVTLAYPKSISSIIHPKEHALIVNPIDDSGTGYHQPLDQKNFENLVNDKDVIVVGPGLANNQASMEMVHQLLTTDKTLVIDADGLRVFTIAKTILPRTGATILTPHPGEMKRLIAALNLSHLLEEDRITQAKTTARKLNAFIVLKGANTVIASPKGEIFVNSSGGPALATGGTGDVLAGIIAAFLCQFQDVLPALKSAVFIHGLAGELSPHGMRNFIADDLLKNIGKALKEITPFA